MRFPTSSFEEDKNLSYKLGARSVVADGMRVIHAVAAYYEDGEYWFIIEGQPVPWCSGQLGYYFATAGNRPYQYLFEAIHKLADIFEYEGYPPAPPIIDPIYFGT
jgi:hypothetical protein